jgi:hypothetical protein
MSTPPLRCPQRFGFLSTLNLSERPPRSIWFFTINPHKEEDNTNFLVLNYKLGSSRATLNHLGDKFSRVTNTNEIIGEDEQSALASEWLTLRFAPILSQVLKNQERSLGIRRRSSRFEIE